MFFQLFSVYRDISTQIHIDNNLLPQSKCDSKQKPQLDDSFFTNILSCEELLHSHKYGINAVEQLVNSYSQLVEYFDQKNAGFKAYFLEKIQFLLSRPESVKLLLAKYGDQQFETPFKIETLFTLNDENEFYKNQETPLVRYSIHKNKFQRATQIKIFIDVEEQKVKCEKDLNILLKEYEQTSIEYDKLITESLASQQKQLQEKLKQRSGMKNHPKAYSVEKSKSQANFNPQYEEEPRHIHIAQFNDHNEITVREKLVNEVAEGVIFMRKSISLINQRSQNVQRKL